MYFCAACVSLVSAHGPSVVITVLFGGRAWVGRLVAGLAILGYAGYRLISNQPGSVTAVAAALGLGLIAYAVWSSRQTVPADAK
jgi:hypothetical protein